MVSLGFGLRDNSESLSVFTVCVRCIEHASGSINLRRTAPRQTGCAEFFGDDLPAPVKINLESLRSMAKRMGLTVSSSGSQIKARDSG